MDKEIGIKNPGSMCYVNVVLQLFHKIFPLRNAVLSLEKSIIAPPVKRTRKFTRGSLGLDTNEPFKFLLALRNIFAELDGKSSPPDPSNFYSSTGYGEKSVFIQEDSREFLEFVLNKLSSEFESEPMDKHKNLIRKLFNIRTKSTTSAPQIPEPVNKKENQLLIMLQSESGNNFEECFDHYLNSNIQFRISKEKARPIIYVDATKSIQFLKVPPVLLFSFNRVQTIGTGKNQTYFKDQKKIEFPLELDISRFMVTFTGNEDYFLYGIIAHRGDLNSGHYTFYKRNNDYLTWTLFNDSMVSTVNSDEIESLFGQDQDSSNSKANSGSFSPLAYLLVFVQKSKVSLICPGMMVIEQPIEESESESESESEPEPEPNPDKDEEEEESRSKSELKESALNGFGELYENYGDVLNRLGGKLALEIFMEFLHTKMKFLKFSLVPKNKNTPEILFDIEEQQENFENSMEEAFNESLTGYFFPLRQDEKTNSVVKNSNEVMTKEIKDFLGNADLTLENFQDKIISDMITTRGKWEMKEDLPTFSGICSRCRKKKHNVWIIDEGTLTYICDDCREKEGPKPQKKNKVTAKKVAPRKRGKLTGDGPKSKRVRSKSNGKSKKGGTTKGTPKKRASRAGKTTRTNNLCETCGKNLYNQAGLIRHKRVHTGEKPYKCEFCNKYFSLRSVLVVHRRIHTGEEPYKCSDCGKSFRTIPHLNRHKVIHMGEKPAVSCPICGKSFRNRYALSNHRRVHMGVEKKVQCPVCGKYCRDVTNLRAHNRVHTGEKPFTCKKCGASFPFKSNFVRHTKKC